MPKPEYKRLTRARPRGGFSVAFSSRSSLWLGADHLLFVDSNGYSETYKRFYFRDIQAFVLQRTRMFTIVNIVFSVPFVLVMALALVSQTTGLKIFLFSLAGFFALVIVINLLLGRTCRCFLRTAVQVEALPPLHRVRRAQKVFARLRPLIAAAQGGELSAPTISDLMQEHARSCAGASEAIAPQPDIPPRLDA